MFDLIKQNILKRYSVQKLSEMYGVNLSNTQDISEKIKNIDNNKLEVIKSNYYDVLNKKYSKSKKDLIFNINKKVIKQTRKDFYDINKDLVLNINQKYFIYDRYDNNKRNEFTVKKIDLVDFKKLKTIYRILGFSSIEELKKSLKTISIEKNYIEFNHKDTDKCVMLVCLEWN